MQVCRRVSIRYTAAPPAARIPPRPEFPFNTPFEYQLLACRCWESDPSIRPDFEQIIRDLTRMRAKLAPGSAPAMAPSLVPSVPPTPAPAPESTTGVSLSEGTTQTMTGEE